MISPEEIEYYLKIYLSVHPGDAGRFLDVISSALSFYEQAQKEKRERRAWHAFEMILDEDLVNRLPVAATIDAVYQFFPKGIVGQGFSAQSISAWKAFVKRCSEVPVDYKWLDLTRGADYTSWYDLYIRPEIERIDCKAETRG